MNNEIEAAFQYQSKLRFYFLALVFTLLAAAIQSAPLAEMSGFSASCEVFGWFCLLVSGLSALSYLEKSPLIYQHKYALKTCEFEAGDKTEIKDQLKNIEDSASVRYALAKYGFIVGIVMEAISRASHGLLN